MEYIELSLLNACITHGKAYEVMAKVGAEDFSDANRPIFKAVQQLADEGVEPDLLVVAEKLEHWGFEDPFNMLSESLEFISPGNVESQCKKLKQQALSRKLKQVSVQISRLAQSEDPESAYEQACNALMDLKASGQDDSLKYMNEMLKSYTEDLERRFESEDEFDGQATGFQAIDERWNGMKPQNLIVVAGRPGMAKTTFVLNMIENLVRQGQSWLFFSMEMSHDELTGKSISSTGRLSYTRLSNAKLVADDWPKLTSAVSLLRDGNLAVDDKPARSIQDMRARAYEVKQKFGRLDGIAADYLQLMRGEGRSREDEIGGLTRGLKQLAKELDCPVVIISQLNRKCEERNNKRPILADLRDSGAIEQDANIVAFIYRDDMYNKDSPLKGIAEINTAKFRGGKTGTDCLAWVGDYQRFDNLEHRPDVEAVAEQQEQPQSRSRAF